jgi:hypothetical protein
MRIDDFLRLPEKAVGPIYLDVIRSQKFIGTLPALRVAGIANPVGDDPTFEWEGHLRRLERILVVATEKTGYYQGFNELVIPLYWVMMCGVKKDELDIAEGLTWKCLTALFEQSDLLDLYPVPGKYEQIVHGVRQFEGLTKRHAPEVAAVLASARTDTMLYSLRWFSLMFVQDLDLPDVLTIWDAAFTHLDHLSEFLFCVGVGILEVLTPRLVEAGKNLLAVLGNLGISGDEVVRLANGYYGSDHWFRDRWIPKLDPCP